MQGRNRARQIHAEEGSKSSCHSRARRPIEDSVGRLDYSSLAVEPLTGGEGVKSERGARGIDLEYDSLAPVAAEESRSVKIAVGSQNQVAERIGTVRAVELVQSCEDS